MKFLLKIAMFAGAAGMLWSCSTASPSYEALRQGFVTPPDTMQLSVYWYWISDNISKEGVVKDLQSMKRVGINRAFIGNIGLDDVPYGKVKMFTPEWWDIMRTALKTASDLNIEIGIFNSPGWSQSGGPWIEPGEAMRYLASSETVVEGPARIERRLPQPNAMFQDVKVLAYPAPNDMDRNITVRNIALNGADKTEIMLRSPEDITVRSLTVRTTKSPMRAVAQLQVKEGDQYRVIKNFEIDRSNPALNVGFDPYAPVVESFDEVTAREFRLVVSRSGGGLAEVTLSAVPRVERYSEKSLAKMFQTPLPYWHEYQWKPQPESRDKRAVIDPSAVIDISASMDSTGMLRWDVPVGRWIIQRAGMTPTGTTNSPASPEGRGYEVDKLSKKHTQEHFYSFIGMILDSIPSEDRRTFRVVVQDSYETGGQNFTDDFLAEFRERYGYDALPYLPVYEGWVVSSRGNSDRFLWDVRRLVADKVAYDYVGGLRDICHQHGLRTWLENYGHWGFPGEFLQYGGQSDEIGGEFWSEGELGDIENRAASSCGHIYGKQKISAESFTSGGPAFLRYPAMMKQRGDRFFAEGINNTLLHVYVSQAYRARPGMNAWFGNEFNRNNTWFSQMDVFADYLKRSNYMLQQGLNVADVAYFIGEDAPKMTGVTDPPLPRGYQFDYINAEVLEHAATVRDGKITLPHGTQYRILVLPKLETMRPELLSKIQQLVLDGAVVLGPPPSRSPSLQNQPAADLLVQATAFDMWGDLAGVDNKTAKYGKGMVLYGVDMEQALAKVECRPDFEYNSDANIVYNHRTMPGEEIYFVSNQTDSPQSFDGTFRVEKGYPELWLATTGEIRRADGVKIGKGVTTVPMTLAPYESVFVVFSDKKGSDTKGYSAPVAEVRLDGAWEVNFDGYRGGPQEPVVFTSLTDWKDNDDPRIKYYSGTAVYNKEFTTSFPAPGERVMIDLGALSAMAKVKVNGEYAGGVWTPPYELDITELIRDGSNKLEVEVVNTWVNRLIGDSSHPQRNRRTWSPVNQWRPDSPLQPSGLFGPVRVLVRK